jgi:hypothetical protein
MNIFVEDPLSPWAIHIESQGILSGSDLSLDDYDVFILKQHNSALYSQVIDLDNEKIIILPTSSEISNKFNSRTTSFITPFSLENFSYCIEDKINIASIKKFKINGVVHFSYESVLQDLFYCSTQSNKKINLGKDGKLFCFENLCEVDKRNIRKYMSQILKYASNEIQKPIIFIWKYPYTYKNIFNLRIDVDPERNKDESIALENIKDTVKSLSLINNMVTMAINIYRRDPNYINFIDIFRDDTDVANHGFFHHHFVDKWHQYQNIKLSHDLLSNFKNFFGSVTPEYFWSNKSAKIIEELKYSYSSSLGFDFSSYPYKPVIENNQMSYYELPAIPLVYSKFAQAFPDNEHEILELYKKIIFQSVDSHSEPCLMYEHPAVLGQKPEIIRAILEAVSESGIMPITLGKLTDWHQRRSLLAKKLKLYNFKGNYSLKLDKNKSYPDFSIAYAPYDSDNIMIYRIDDLQKNNGNLSSTNYCDIFKDDLNNSLNIGSSIFYSNEKKISFIRTRKYAKKIFSSYRLYYFYLFSGKLNNYKTLINDQKK